MSSLASLLRQVTKKSQHPNSLIHQVQLARAKQRYLVRGAELESGEGEAMALASPDGLKDKEEVEKVKQEGSQDIGDDKNQNMAEEAKSDGHHTRLPSDLLDDRIDDKIHSEVR